MYHLRVNVEGVDCGQTPYVVGPGVVFAVSCWFAGERIDGSCLPFLSTHPISCMLGLDYRVLGIDYRGIALKFLEISAYFRGVF